MTLSKFLYQIQIKTKILKSPLFWLQISAFLLAFSGRFRFFIPNALLYEKVAEFLIPEIFLFEIPLAIALILIVSQLKSLPSITLFSLSSIGYILILLSGSVAIMHNAIFSNISWFEILRLIWLGLISLVMSSYTFSYDSLSKIAKWFMWGALISSAIAILQFVLGSALTTGIISHVLGEQPVSLVTPGVSKIHLLGKEFIRAYGTFNHPNILGAYLLFTLVIWYQFFRKSLWILPIIIFGILVSFSRLPLIFGLLFLGYLFLHHTQHKKTIVLVFILLFTLFLGYRSLSLFSSNTDSFTERLTLLSYSSEMIKDHPLGIAPNHFTIFLSSYDTGDIFEIPTMGSYTTTSGVFHNLQPVHNSVILIIVEYGILAGIGIVLILFDTLLSTKNPLLITIWVGLFIMASFDHYFVTNIQLQMLFVIIVLASKHKSMVQ